VGNEGVKCVTEGVTFGIIFEPSMLKSINYTKTDLWHTFCGCVVSCFFFSNHQNCKKVDITIFLGYSSPNFKTIVVDSPEVTSNIIFLF